MPARWCLGNGPLTDSIDPYAHSRPEVDNGQNTVDARASRLTEVFCEKRQPPCRQRTLQAWTPERITGGVSRLDGKEDEIRQFIDLGVSKSAIAKITGVSKQILYHFIRTRDIASGP